MSLIVNDVNEFNALLETNALVVADFFATWCYPCKMLAPVLEKAEKDYPNVRFVKIDVDKAQELAIQYKIQYMPSLVFIKNGAVASMEIGAKDEAELKSILDKFVK